MKRTLKQILSVFLVAVMVFGSAPLSGLTGFELPSLKEFFSTKANASSDYYKVEYTYTIKNDQATITKCSTSSEGNIPVPSSLEGYEVSTISSYAFSNCSKITGVIIPSTIDYIGQYAFKGCTALSSVIIGNDSVASGTTIIDLAAFMDCGNIVNVTIGSSVSSIGTSAFRRCGKLTNLVLNNGLTSIEANAFSDCVNLTDLIVPNSVTDIGIHAFDSCVSLKCAIIGNGVKNIGSCAFENCTSLKYIHLPESVTSIGSDFLSGSNAYICSNTDTCFAKTYASRKNIEFKICNNEHSNTGGEITNPSYDATNSYKNGIYTYVIEDGNATIVDCDDSAYGNITLPSVLDGYTVRRIGENAFAFCKKITGICIPSEILSVGKAAFANCSELTFVIFPHMLLSDSIQNKKIKIEENAFVYCEKLSCVHFPAYSADSFDINSDISLSAKAHICSDKKDCFAKSYTEKFGYKFKLCDGNHFLGCEMINPNFVFSSSDYTQTHVINNYSKNNDVYEAAYFSGNGVAMDGTGGNVDLCVPGLNKVDNMVPQGITYYPQKDWILISAYSKDEDVASVIYALDKSSGKYVAQFDIYKSDGGKFTGKLGGIAVSNNNLYLTNGQSVSYITLSEFDVDYGTKKNVNIASTKSLSRLFGEANVSYVSFTDGVLYIGNFYNNTEKYKKPVTDTVHSAVFGYTLSGDDSSTEWNNFNKDSKPDYKYVVPNSIMEIQCATVKNGYLCLSSSYGRKNKSSLYVVKVGNRTNVTFDDVDYSCLAPPMMEGITFIGNDLYAVFESGAYFYREKDFYNKALNPTDVVWKVDCQSVLDEIENAYSVGDYKDIDIAYKDGWISLDFKQSWFENNSLQYNHNLAQLCSQFVTLGYEESALLYGLHALGFNPTEVFWETKAEKDKVDNFIANRDITVNGETYTLLFVGCIGTNSVQWYSNFEPGTEGTHASFNDAKNYVYDNIQQYILDNAIDTSKTKILLFGHSRGAATANLLGAQLIDEEIFATKDNIYTYTFATPNPTSSKNISDEKYSRIYNFVNPEDFVTKVIPAQWGYSRYGTTYALPSCTNTNLETYITLELDMQKEYGVIMNNQEYHSYLGGESQTYDVVQKLTSVVKDINQLYSKKFNWLGEQKSIQQFFAETVCKYMANEKGSSGRKAAQDLLIETFAKRTESDSAILALADYFVLYQGLGGFTSGIVMDDYFTEAHQAETYCAYMLSMTASQATTIREGYKNTVNCPVDIEVYDKVSGELVGKIVNNVVDEEIAAKENSIVMYVEGDSKSFWLPSNGEYDVKLIGNDDGVMDYTVSKADSSGAVETQRINFVEVDVTDNKFMLGEFTGEEFILSEYVLTSEDGNDIKCDDVITSDNAVNYECEVSVSVEGSGTVSGNGTYIKGDYVTLSAVSSEYGEFIGWFNGNNLISVEQTYSFVVKKSQHFTAKFKTVFDIISPSTTTISYGDKIVLHAFVSDTIPDGWYVEWIASNSNFNIEVSSDSTTCTISPNKSGDTTFTATVYDASGKVISEDTQEMTSKAGFFQKIIAFFKKLFGLTKTIPQIYKGIF